jgi:hypothetical protein
VDPDEGSLWNDNQSVPVGNANRVTQTSEKVSSSKPRKTEEAVRAEVKEENRLRIQDGKEPWDVEERVQKRMERLEGLRAYNAKCKASRKNQKFCL